MDKLTYYHGGVPGLKVGDCILPPSMTGTPTNRLILAEIFPNACKGAAASPDLVWVTTERIIAERHTWQRKGWVYRVEPIPPLSVDEFYYDKNCYDCPSAMILEVFPLTEAERERARCASWGDPVMFWTGYGLGSVAKESKELADNLYYCFPDFFDRLLGFKK